MILRVVLIAHYYPPINSSGAKRAESLSKYFVALGHKVTVITTCKSGADGKFTESVPTGVRLLELGWTGREKLSREGNEIFEPMYSGRPSWKRRLKDKVMAAFGQIPDPRLPFALAFLVPWFSQRAGRAIRDADIVIGTTPPWPMVLAAVLCKWRFKTPCVLDYRDQFSDCHEMPGGSLAKWLERIIDKRLVHAADRVVCISEPMSRYYNSFTKDVDTILNGYDDELLAKARAAAHVIRDGKIRIRYMGIVSPGRVPHNLLRALVALEARRPDLFEWLCIEFYGNAAIIQEELSVAYSTISTAFYFYPQIPYADALQKIVEADYLLFAETSSRETLSAQGILTTKLFEYIGAGRPILADIAKNTLAGSLLLKCGGQHIVSESSDIFFDAISDASFYVRAPDTISPMSASLSRKAQAIQYINLVQNVVEQKR